MFTSIMASFTQLMLSDSPIILSVILLSSLLALETSLMVATIAYRLPKKQQQKTILFGLFFGLLLRILALLMVGFFTKYPFVKLVGALYLLYIAYIHFYHTQQDSSTNHLQKPQPLLIAIINIGMVDIALGIDQVIATFSISAKPAVVLLGTIFGGLGLIITTSLTLLLIKRYHLLETLAYVMVAFIGATLVLEEIAHMYMPNILKSAMVIIATLSTVIYEEIQHRKQHRQRMLAKKEDVAL